MRRAIHYQNPFTKIDVFYNKNALAIFTRGWFIEGVFYITFIALLWSNEEPAKLNTLLAAWSAYAIVAVALFQAKKSGTIINPAKWIRVYFFQSLLLLLVCDFIWLRGCVARAPGDYYDPIRFDWYAVVLAESGMVSNAVTFQNFTGTIWYAGFIYWIFGVSKFYVALFNGALSFVTWVMFASIMKHIEGNPRRWQWSRFGVLIPDFILPFANISKEPLSAFVLVLGAWVVARGMGKKQPLSKSILPLIPVLIMGLVVRAATAVLITTVACIWLWKSAEKRGKVAMIVLLCAIFIGGQFVTDYTMKVTGGMHLDWSDSISRLFDPDLRMRLYLDYPTSSDSWNVITESLPLYLMPITATIRGFFVMVSPMPLWNIHVLDIWNRIGTEGPGTWLIFEQLSRKGTAWLFILSLPWLLAGFFEVYRRNRRLWIMTSLTYIVIISLMGFGAYGIIEARYRPMILPFWLSACAAGHYYGRPKRYLIPGICIAVIGCVIYLIPKVL